MVLCNCEKSSAPYAHDEKGKPVTKIPKDARLLLRLEHSLREALEREAARDRRPLASMARKILADHFDREAGRGYRVDTRSRVA